MQAWGPVLFKISEKTKIRNVWHFYFLNTVREEIKDAYLEEFNLILL